MILSILLGLIALVALFVALFLVFLSTFLTSIYYSIQPEPPVEVSDSDLKSLNKCPLFRHVPSLKTKIAWSELGNNFPTPIQQAKVKLNRNGNGKEVKFWMKREDLSSTIYGGNKVRTLQFQLPACKIHADKNPDAKFYVVGSGGSNQCVATMAHGQQFGLNISVGCVMPDEPDLDNTLNLLSSISYKPSALYLWDNMRTQLSAYLTALYWSNGKNKIFGLGGNSLGGVLGQMSAVLELAEQIERRELPDVDAIYLPMGSSCTTTGLILGVCLARHLKMRAFQSPKFKIVSTMIDHKMGRLQRNFNFMRRSISKYICITPLFGILHVCKYFKKITNGGIDLEKQGLEFWKNHWEVVADSAVVGLYGGHSVKSKIAAELDTKIEVSGGGQVPWLCGHFSAKSFAVMIQRLEYEEDGGNVLLWQTKSIVQPLSNENANEWDTFCKITKNSQVVEKWANEGKAESKLRPGKVDTLNGSAGDYRHLMKVAGK